MSTWQDINGDMFDFRSYYDRIAHELPDGCRVAEVGVADGKSAIYLAETLHGLGKNFEFYFIDNMDYGGPNQITEIVKNISRCGLGNGITLLPISSLDAAAKFNNNFFDFCFLDSSHETMQTKAEVMAWWHKVKHNCCLSGHDYHLYPGVKQAVNELIPKTKIYQDEIPKVYDSLEIFDTEKGYGVWQIRKSWQAKLNIEY